MNKTLIGKNGYLFLTNDTCKELEVHCQNLNLIKNKSLPHLNFDNYMMILFPNKSLYYKNYLPDEYVVKYRPAFEIYKNKLQDKMLDCYEILKNIDDAYYKTDTHINLKGNYEVYLKFIEKVNNDYELNLKAKYIKIEVIENIELSSLNYGIGDLTWPSNLGNQTLINKNDNYYYSTDFSDFYMRHKINNNDNIMFFDYELNNKTDELNNLIVDWNIISKYIIYKKNKNGYKVIIFYDSFILNILPLYIELFNEIYLIKSVYNNKLIDIIKPDYIFEFRLERFLL